MDKIVSMFIECPNEANTIFANLNNLLIAPEEKSKIAVLEETYRRLFKRAQIDDNLTQKVHLSANNTANLKQDISQLPSNFNIRATNLAEFDPLSLNKPSDISCSNPNNTKIQGKHSGNLVRKASFVEAVREKNYLLAEKFSSFSSRTSMKATIQEK